MVCFFILFFVWFLEEEGYEFVWRLEFGCSGGIGFCFWAGGMKMFLDLGLRVRVVGRGGVSFYFIDVKIEVRCGG